MTAHQRALLAQGLACWYRGRLIPVMRGGDSLFPELPATPEEFTALTDEQIAEHLEASLAAKDKIVAQDPEFLGELSATEILEVMKAGVQGILALKAEQAVRVEAQSNLAAELAALDAQVTPEAALAADDPADPADPDLADPDPADPADPALAADPPEPVVAAADPPRPLRRLPAAGRHQAVVTTGPEYGMTLRASAGLEQFGEGAVLDPQDGANSLNKAIVEKIRRTVSTPAGFRETVVVASADIKAQMPEWRKLHMEDSDTEKIQTLVAAAKAHGVGYDGEDWSHAEALTASGGICAPVTPYYQLAFISTMQRPVRDSLVGFVADRGGINFAPPPYLEQITDGVGVISAAQDAAGGTAGTKTCQTLICPEFQVVEVNSIFHCFTGGNLGQRAFPEQASQFSSLILAQHARVAETQLLNQIKAGSTNVIGQSTVLGAISSLLNDLLTAAAAYRSNNRMPKDAPLQVILPEWTADLLLIDLIQSQFQRFEFNQAGLEQLFNSMNLRVTYTLDGPTDGEGSVLPRQAAGAMNGLPTVVEWAMFAPGSWLFVDSGVLELGIVRDSVLNATNSYQVFGESWEAAAGIGVQSLWVTSDVCPSGQVALPVDNTDQCYAAS